MNLKQPMQINDPKTIIRGTGNTYEGVGKINLYEMGVLIHPFEYDTILQSLIALMYCVIALVD